MDNVLLLFLIVPLIAGILALLIPKKVRGPVEVIVLSATGLNLLLAAVFFKSNLAYFCPWVPAIGLDFSLRFYHFSAFIILATAAFGFLIALYSTVSLSDKTYAKHFFAYFLITIGLVNGAVLSDNLLLLLFFWEGMLVTLFLMIAVGNKSAFKTAAKALIIVGITDLCLMVGIVLTGHLAGTRTISGINLPLDALGGLAFVFLMIGAISKAGSMPFHSWIPDAALDAPLPFMAFLPGALEKLVGIYLLSRISLDLFQLHPGSWVSTMLMIVGAVTIILAVMMALVQKDYKRLLSYHAISQVGYMVLGIGTAIPIGIIGGLFHMINNAMYKSCLFLTGGAVEKQAGTTDLEKLGGLGLKMPITFACFIVAAVSISGVPPFNGFFSKELIYDSALERNLIFYLVAVIGSFFTAASFLKLGHAAFLGKLRDEHRNVKEAPPLMLVPMIIIALGCIVFGIYNKLPIHALIQPILSPERLEGHQFAGWPANTALVVITIIVLAGAFLNHRFGVKKKGSGLKAVDHIHYAPVLHIIYDKAEKRFFDPYNIGLKIINIISEIAWRCDRAIDWVYDTLVVKVTYACTNQIRKAHTGNYATYLVWSLVGFLLIAVFLLQSGKM
ncbi:MAG: NADH-quinone oxidoreductase subunit L [Candidatus Omnitrophica bacterium]|nr:NADH-quinone oxidoreductase subunit L [Candidatus Omnitrophota bacterium]